MNDGASAILQQLFPEARERWFAPMTIGSSRESADEGAAAILAGIKTATSSGHWNYPDGRLPFAGALSVLLDGSGRALAIVETAGVEIIRFGEVDAARASAYGEGERSLDWWRRVIGAWYLADAAAHGVVLDDDTPLIWERIAVLRRL
jgi:uncharacterized protein YhfF